MTLVSSNTVTDGRVHKVVLKRRGAEVSMQVDDEEAEINHFSYEDRTRFDLAGNIYAGYCLRTEFEALTKGRSLLTTYFLFIFSGGLPEYYQMTNGVFESGLNGCIHSLTIQGTPVDFKRSVILSKNTQECSK